MEQGVTVGVLHPEAVLLVLVGEYLQVYDVFASHDAQQLRFVFALQLCSPLSNVASHLHILLRAPPQLQPV